jgi:membrane-associated phospholipid phosphatase
VGTLKWGMRELTKKWPLGLENRAWPLFWLTILVVLAILSQLDAWVSQTLIAWPDSWRAPFFFITDYGLSDWILIPSLVIFILAFAISFALPQLWRAAMCQLAAVSGFIFLGVGVPGLLVTILKRIIGRSRPVEFAEHGAFGFEPFVNQWNFQSFPSGHTVTAIALAFTIGFLWPRLFWPLLVLGLIVGLSRIPVGAHYPTDVFSGLVCGVLGTFLVRNVFLRKNWLFAQSADGSITRQPFSAIKAAFQRDRV